MKARSSTPSVQFSTPSVAYSYIRFSTPEQAKGDSLRRQTEAAVAWCQRNGVSLDTSTTLHDLGKSAYTGTHRSNPDRHALAAFLRLVEKGKVPRGSYLVIENLDRLSREEIQPALLLALNLLQAGVRIVQLKPVEMVFDDKSDTLPVMMMMMELSRGHGESAIKSERLGAAWDEKRAQLATRKLTGKCPFWLTLSEDRTRFTLKPEAVELVKRMLRLAREGNGSFSLARRLNSEGILSPYGRSWNNVSVLSVLRNRAVLGEFTPHRGNPGKRTPVGPAIPDYYPRIIDDREFYAAQQDIELRKQQRGPRGQGVRNIFTELLRDARDGSSFHITAKRPGDYRMVSDGARCGKSGSAYVSFAYPVFEEAILSFLREIEPREILGTDQPPDATLSLTGELVGVEARIAELEAELHDNGDVVTLARVLRSLEGKRKDLTNRLAEARQREAHPLDTAWSQTQNLLGTLKAASDPADARLRLRSALRRIVDSIWLLVVPRGELDRLIAVQVWFRDTDKRRDFLVLHRPPRQTGTVRREGAWLACSLAQVADVADVDLRERDHAARLEKVLVGMDLACIQQSAC